MNIELLIALVKERSVLYDSRNPLFRDKRVKDTKWREICTALNVTIESAKTRWRSLKDCYTKHLKSTKTTTGQGSSKYVHWQWAKHMEFMKPHLSFAPTMTKLEKQEHLETDDLSSSDKACNIQCTQSSSDVQGTQASSNLLGPHERSPQRRRRRTAKASPSGNASPNMERIIQYFENKKKNTYDATELIFIGYAKSIKPFSIRRQARIKMNIAKMIIEEEVAHFEETTSHSSRVHNSDSSST